MLNRGLKEQTVSVFKNGRSRAVRIPKDFDFGGDEMLMRQEEDGSLKLEPVRKKMSPKQLVEWLRSQPPIADDFPEIDDSDMLPLDEIKF